MCIVVKEPVNGAKKQKQSSAQFVEHQIGYDMAVPPSP
jgi:hypothetical protein